MRKGRSLVLSPIIVIFSYGMPFARPPAEDLNVTNAFTHGIGRVYEASLLYEDNECARVIEDYTKYIISTSYTWIVRNTNFVFSGSKLNGTIDIPSEPKYVTLGWKKRKVDNARFVNKSTRGNNE